MPERRVVEIPYAPRLWAQPFHDSFARWSALVLHRRAGKTTAVLNHHQRAALDNDWETQRLKFLAPTLTAKEIAQLLKRRTYWHVMPTFRQGKLTGAWDTLKEISRVVPGSKPNESELLVKYPNGNKVQIIGADSPDSLRGPALSGVSLDEFSQIPANAFSEVISKALGDHLGYGVFSGTIKGKDQLYRTFKAALGDGEWFSLWQDIDQSLATEEGATITALRQAMLDDRALVAKGLMTQAEFDQEWYLSAEAAIKGAFYGHYIKDLNKQGRMTAVPYDPMLPVDTDWDLGIDAMAIWFSQSTRSGEIRLIDYYENVGGGLEVAIKAVKGQSGDTDMAQADARRASYVYGEHWAPHDIEVREITSGITRRKAAKSLGVNFKVTPKLPVAEGITAVQLILPRCWFDEKATDSGLEALRHYRRTYQQKFDQFSETPVHDWSSHGSDAFRGLAVRHKAPKPKEPEPEPVPAGRGNWQSV